LILPARAQNKLVDPGDAAPVVSKPVKTIISFRTEGESLATRRLKSEPSKKDCPGCLRYETTGTIGFFDTVRTFNRFLVQDCARKAAMKSFQVVAYKKFPCTGTKLDSVRLVRWDLEKFRQGVRLGLSVRYIIPKDVDGERARRMWLDTVNQ